MQTLIVLLALSSSILTKSLQSRSCTYREYQYKLSTEKLSWSESQQACKAWNGTLATYEDEPEKSHLAAVFDKSNNRTDYWLDGNYPLDTHQHLHKLGRNCSSIRQIKSDPKRLKITPKPCEMRNKFICKKNGFVDNHNDSPMEYCPVQIKHHPIHRYVPMLGNPPDEFVYRISTEYLNNTEAKSECQAWGGKIARVRGNAITQQKCYIESLLDHTSRYWIEPEGQKQMNKVRDWQKHCYIFDHRRDPRIKSWINWIDMSSVCTLTYRFICEKLATQDYKTPDIVHNVAVIQEGCFVVIEWNQPNSCDQNNPISHYQVEVKEVRRDMKPSKRYVVMPECNTDPTISKCTVPFDSFMDKKPYKFMEGSTIEVRVKACNVNGCSHAYSDMVMSTFTLHNKPVIKTPVLRQEDRQLHLTWLKIPEVKYTLLWDEGKSPDEIYCKTKGNCPDFYKTAIVTFAASHTFMAERPICRHQFKVLPQVGICFGEKTAVLAIDMNTEPARMKAMEFQADEQNCTMKMDWVIPDDGCLPIRYFQFEMGTYKGENKYNYKLMPREVCGANPRGITCIVKMPKLLELFEFIPGNPVAIRGKACNDKGCAKEWSPAQQESTIPFKKPAKVEKPRNILLPKVKKLELEWAKLELNPAKPVTYELEWINKNKMLRGIERFESGILKPGTIQKFQVRARNVCGPGPFSDMLVEMMPTVPKKPSVVIRTEKCQARISWPNIADGGLPVTQYTSELRLVDDSVIDPEFILSGCPSTPNTTECIIPMEKLVAKPFELPLCSVIAARVQAKNLIGWGEFSEQLPNAPIVFYKPVQMAMPQLSRYNVTRIKVEWDGLANNQSGCSPFINYELQWDGSSAFKRPSDGVQESAPSGKYSWAKLNETNALSHIQSDSVELCREYTFRIRGVNDCSEDKDPFSDVAQIFLKTVPERMDTLQVSSHDGLLTLRWGIPFNCRAAIYKFSIEIEQKENGKWIEQDLPCLKDPTRQSCTIPIPDLSRPPNNIPECTPIRARITAQNEYGWGQKSVINVNPPLAYYRPPPVPQPTIRVFDLTMVEVSWKKAYSPCKPNPTYELKWGEGFLEIPDALLSAEGGSHEIGNDEDDYTGEVEAEYETTSFNTTGGIEKCKNYKFKVKAKNDQGGDFSPPVDVFTVSEPQEITDLTMDSRGCQVTFFWKAPFDCQSKITNYMVEILAGNGTFMPVTHCGKYATDRNCTVQMPTLQRYFGLKQGDQIQVRAAAINPIGIANFSEVLNPTHHIVVQVPHKMTQPLQTDCTRTTGELSFSWAPPIDVTTGGRPILEYKVLWDSGTGGATDKDLTTGNYNTFAVDGLEYGAWYQFKVQARNVCDWGPFSTMNRMTTCQNETQWQFKLSTTTATQEEAQLSCVDWGGNLASLETEMEIAQLHRYMDKSNLDRLWVGLHSIVDQKDNHYWIHRAECNLWTKDDGKRIDYFESDESQQQGQVCVELFRQNQRRSKALKSSPIGCFEERKYICQKVANRKIYRVSTEELALDTAQEFCLGWGGHLARINNPQEKADIDALLDSTDTYWIAANQKRWWVNQPPPTTEKGVSVARKLVEQQLLDISMIAGPNTCASFIKISELGQIQYSNDCLAPRKFICERVGNDINCPVKQKPACKPLITHNLALTAGIIMLILMFIMGALVYYFLTKRPLLFSVRPLTTPPVFPAFQEEATPLQEQEAIRVDAPLPELTIDTPMYEQKPLTFPSVDINTDHLATQRTDIGHHEKDTAGHHEKHTAGHHEKHTAISHLEKDKPEKDQLLEEPDVVMINKSCPRSMFKFPPEPILSTPEVTQCMLHDAPLELSVKTTEKVESQVALAAPSYASLPSLPKATEESVAEQLIPVKAALPTDYSEDVAVLSAQVEEMLIEQPIVLQRPKTGKKGPPTPSMRSSLPTPQGRTSGMVSEPKISAKSSSIARGESPMPPPSLVTKEPEAPPSLFLKFQEEPPTPEELIETPCPDLDKSDVLSNREEDPDTPECPREPTSEMMQPRIPTVDSAPVCPTKQAKRKLRKGLTKPSPLFCLRPELAMLKHEPRDCQIQFNDDPGVIHKGENFFRNGEYGYDRTIVGYPQILMKPYRTLDRTQMNRSSSADKNNYQSLSQMQQELLRPNSSYGLLPDKPQMMRPALYDGMRTRDPYTPNIKVPSVRLQLHNFVGLSRVKNQKLMNKTIDLHTPRYKQRSPNLHTNLRHRLKSAAGGRPRSRSPGNNGASTKQTRLFSPQVNQYDGQCKSNHHTKCLLTNVLS